MSDLYERIDNLCKKNRITITTMCKESGVSRGSMTDLKNGRSQKLSADALSKIAAYFQVTVDYLLSGENEETAPLKKQEHRYNPENIIFALSRGGEKEITPEMFQEVVNFAEYVAAREDAKEKDHES